MLLGVSDKEPPMKDNRPVRRSFVKRLDAERRWTQLYRLLLELGSNHGPGQVAADTVASAPALRTEVPNERRRLCPSVNPTPSRGANDHPTARPLTSPGADRGLDDCAPASL